MKRLVVLSREEIQEALSDFIFESTGQTIADNSNGLPESLELEVSKEVPEVVAPSLQDAARAARELSEKLSRFGKAHRFELTFPVPLISFTRGPRHDSVIVDEMMQACAICGEPVTKRHGPWSHDEGKAATVETQNPIFEQCAALALEFFYSQAAPGDGPLEAVIARHVREVERLTQIIIASRDVFGGADLTALEVAGDMLEEYAVKIRSQMKASKDIPIDWRPGHHKEVDDGAGDRSRSTPNARRD